MTPSTLTAWSKKMKTTTEAIIDTRRKYFSDKASARRFLEEIDYLPLKGARDTFIRGSFTAFVRGIRAGGAQVIFVQ